MIDTHAHLDACTEPADRMLERARAAGVTRVIAIGTGIESCRTALALADREPGVFCALGIHPHDAAGADAHRISELRDLLRHERAVAVGETGMDHFRDYAPRSEQRRLFEAQLEVADELGLPVVIHTRAAVPETADALADFDGRVVLHCFSEPELLDTAIDRGYWVSFAGNVTYPKAAALRAAAEAVPGNRLLAETDCPYLSPQPLRGRPNEPAFVLHTLQTLAALRGETSDELAARLDANADEAFSLA